MFNRQNLLTYNICSRHFVKFNRLACLGRLCTILYIMYVGLRIITYHGWKKPEKKIRIVLFINCEITRVTANITHLFVLDDRLCSCFINFSIFYQRRQEKRRTNIVFIGQLILLQLRIYIQVSTRTFVW